MAQAKSKDAETLRVKFVGLPGPPARLVAGEVVIEAGQVAELPAALARELASDSQMGVELTDAEPTPASDEQPAEPVETKNGEPVLQHENPADEPEKE